MKNKRKLVNNIATLLLVTICVFDVISALFYAIFYVFDFGNINSWGLLGEEFATMLYIYTVKSILDFIMLVFYLRSSKLIHRLAAIILLLISSTILVIVLRSEIIFVLPIFIKILFELLSFSALFIAKDSYK